MLTVTQYNSLDSLADLRNIWTELWEQSRYASLFNSFDGFVDHCRLIAEGASPYEPCVLVVTMAGRPVGILPLVRQTFRTKLGTMRRISAPQSQWRTSIEPVGPNSAITLLAAMKHLRDNSRDWDLLELHVDSEAGRRRLMNAVHSTGMSVREQSGPERAIVQIDSGWFEYFDSRAPLLRQRLPVAERRLSVFGDVRLVRFRPRIVPNEPVNMRWDLFAAFLRGAHHSAFSGDERNDVETARTGFNRLHEQAVAAGCADLSVLYVNNRPAAAAYCVHHAGTVDAVRIGWAADTTRDAAFVLVAHLLRDAFLQGDLLFRFPAGAFRLADGWETHTEHSLQLQHFAPKKPRAQLLRFSRWIRGGQSSPGEVIPQLRRDIPHTAESKPRLTIVG